MGKSPEAIPEPARARRPADAVIMVGYALDDLIKQGKVIPGSRVELADSRIGVVVRDGSAKPDVGSPKASSRRCCAKSIAYSDSASGVYIERELFRKLGIEDQVKSKAKMIPRIPVASVVANGDYEIGFQQVSELLPVKGRPSSARSPNRCSRSRASRPASLSARSIRRKRRRCSTISRRPTQADVKSTGLDSVPAH